MNGGIAGDEPFPLHKAVYTNDIIRMRELIEEGEAMEAV